MGLHGLAICLRLGGVDGGGGSGSINTLVQPLLPLRPLLLLPIICGSINTLIQPQLLLLLLLLLLRPLLLLLSIICIPLRWLGSNVLLMLRVNLLLLLLLLLVIGIGIPLWLLLLCVRMERVVTCDRMSCALLLHSRLPSWSRLGHRIATHLPSSCGSVSQRKAFPVAPYCASSRPLLLFLLLLPLRHGLQLLPLLPFRHSWLLGHWQCFKGEGSSRRWVTRRTISRGRRSSCWPGGVFPATSVISGVRRSTHWPGGRGVCCWQP